MATLIEDLKVHLIERLQLDDVTPDAIEDEAPLFGAGLGLDSIDAVELVVMLEKHYGIRITEMEVAKAAFVSMTTLAAFVAEHASAAARS